MKYKRKIDLVKTSEQFRDYLSSKNPTCRKMLEVYDELVKGGQIYFGFDDKYLYFYEHPKPLEALVPGVSPRELFLLVSKKSGDRGRVEIDTGYFKMIENGEVLPSSRAINCNWSLDDWRYNDFDGLKALKEEIDKTLQVYNKVFVLAGRHKKK
jgi:hypothetical protein